MTVQKEIQGKKGILRGIVHKSNKPKGTAIILHGYFSSNRFGPSRLYVKLSRLLVNSGYDVWRFDCYGVGDSDGEFEETTYYSELEDYRAILHSILHENNNPNIMLIGHSMGTNLAIRLADNCSFIKRILLLSPSFGPITYLEYLLDPTNIEELKAQGFTNRKGIYINADFMADSQKDDIYQVCENIKVSTTIIYGTKDELFSLNSAKYAAAKLHANYFFEIDNADHNFINGDSGKRVMMLIESHLINW